MNKYNPLEDLEVLYEEVGSLPNYPKKIYRLGDSYKRLKQYLQQNDEFMSKLREIDLKELTKIGKRHFWIWQGTDKSTHRLYLKDEPEFQSLLDILKGVK